MSEFEIKLNKLNGKTASRLVETKDKLRLVYASSEGEASNELVDSLPSSPLFKIVRYLLSELKVYLHTTSRMMRLRLMMVVKYFQNRVKFSKLPIGKQF